MAITKKQIVEACKKIDPKPEHGAGQYGRVVDHIVSCDDIEPDLFKMDLEKAVAVVMSFMS